MRLVHGKVRSQAHTDLLLPPEFMALKYFEINPGASLSDLAEFMRVRKPTVTPLMRRLMARGFLNRAPNNKDKRAFVVTLTESGRVVLKKGEALFEASFNHLFSVLGSEEQNELSNLLTKVIQSHEK